jgi:mono/diheme cytochrome c family protein
MTRALTAAACILATAAVLVAAGLVYARATRLSARPAPGGLETRLARFVRRVALPDDVSRRLNPVPLSAAALEDGMAHFADHCGSCHGNDGSGATEMGQNLFPKAPDMRGAPTQDLSDGELFWIIENGIRFTGMPGWGDGTPESTASTWNLVHFVRHLPRLSEDELARMEAMMPRSVDEVREELEAERFLRGDDVPPAER